MALGAVGIFALTLSHGLNGDVQYNLGGIAVHNSDTTAGWVDTFTHRPLVYRAFMGALLDLTGAIGTTPATRVPFETAVRMIGVALALGSAYVVWLGLRRYLSSAEALAAGVAIGTALSLAPIFDFLQAEWLAAALAAAAIGVAVAVRSPWLGSSAAGVLLAFAAGAKLSTVVLVPAAIVLIGLLDRRRAAMTAAATAIACVGLLLVSLSVEREWQWIVDIVTFNRSTLESPAFAEVAWVRSAESLLSKVLVSPVIVALPAGIVLVATERGSRRASMACAFLLIGVTALTVLPPFIQVPSLVYHLAPLAVLSSALLAIGLARWTTRTGSVPWPVLGPCILFAIAASALLALPPTWRNAATGPAVALVLCGLGATVAGARHVIHSPSRIEGTSPPHAGRPIVAVTAVALAAGLFLPTMIPNAAWALSTRQSPYTTASWADEVRNTAAESRALRSVIGEDDAVLYLAYGTAAYHLGNPTPCPYPSPLFLQRSTIHDGLDQLPSYADNRSCLWARVDAVVIHPGWLGIGRLADDVTRAIANRFVCPRVLAADSLVVCPAR